MTWQRVNQVGGSSIPGDLYVPPSFTQTVNVSDQIGEAYEGQYVYLTPESFDRVAPTQVIPSGYSGLAMFQVQVVSGTFPGLSAGEMLPVYNNIYTPLITGDVVGWAGAVPFGGFDPASVAYNNANYDGYVKMRVRHSWARLPALSLEWPAAAPGWFYYHIYPWSNNFRLQGVWSRFPS